jgi:hypothetical protein
VDRVGFEPTTSASLAILYEEGSCPFKSSSLFDYPRAWTTTMKNYDDDDDDISPMLLHTNRHKVKMRQKCF